MQKPDYIIELEKQAGLAVERLREDKFSKNLPFMLGELDLKENQFYYEYANGDIAIAEFPENQKQHQIIRHLSTRLKLVYVIFCNFVPWDELILQY